MELHELHVADLGPRAIGQGPGRRPWRCEGWWFSRKSCPAPPVARTTALAQTKDIPRWRSQTRAPRQAPSWVKSRSVKLFCQIRHVGTSPSSRDDGPHHLPDLWHLTQRMDDPGMGMPTFQPEVRRCHSPRRSGFPNESALESGQGRPGRTIATTSGSHSPLPALMGVGDVVVESVLWVENAGDSPLGVSAVCSL